jgi:hypothetical protein
MSKFEQICRPTESLFCTKMYVAEQGAMGAQLEERHPAASCLSMIFRSSLTCFVTSMAMRSRTSLQCTMQRRQRKRVSFDD